MLQEILNEWSVFRSRGAAPGHELLSPIGLTRPCHRGSAAAANRSADLVPVSPNHPRSSPVSPDVISELAPTGVLRAGINLSNFLLVTKINSTGDPEGVSPDLAREVAMRLGVPVKYVPFKFPGELADAADKDIWDIGLIGAEPQRAEAIAFTPAYAEIEATYLVPSGSPLKTIADVDTAGVRIAVTARTAYGLWLDRNIKHAEMIRSETLIALTSNFWGLVEHLAGLRPRLLSDLGKLPSARILDGRFTSVQRRSAPPEKTRLVPHSCATLLKKRGVGLGRAAHRTV